MSEPMESGAALPRAPVLSYLTQVTTAPRVRRVAWIGTLVAGAVDMALAMLVLGLIALEAYHWAAWLAAGPVTLDDFLRALRDLFQDTERYLALSDGLFLVPGIGLLVLAWPVRRGRAWASRLACALLVPQMLVVGLVTALLASVGVIGVGEMVRGRGMAEAWWLLALVPGALIVLLLKDLCAYLLWIARNPHVEKPPVKFLTGQSPG